MLDMKIKSLFNGSRAYIFRRTQQLQMLSDDTRLFFHFLRTFLTYMRTVDI